MTLAQRVKHKPIAGPKKHGAPLCGKCQSRTLQSAKRRASGLCLVCAGGSSQRPFFDVAGPIALRALLKLRGLTLRQFAEEFGASEGLVGKWCRGNWRPQTYYRKLLADRYAIPESAWGEKRKPHREQRDAERRRPKQRLVEVRH